MTDSGILKRISIASTIVVVIGLADMPYGYYSILKIVLFAASIATIWIAKSRVHETLIWPLGAAVILYNPLIPIRFGDKDIWVVINIITLLLLWTAAFFIGRTKQELSPDAALPQGFDKERFRQTIEQDMVLVEPVPGSLATKLAGVTIKRDCLLCKTRFSFVSGAIPFFKNRHGSHFTLCRDCLEEANTWRISCGITPVSFSPSAFVDQ